MRLFPSIIMVIVSAIGFIAWLYLNQSATTGRCLFIVSILAIIGCLLGFLFGLRFIAEYLDRNK
jgi:hypothetical protein